jgi:hypothetical protein
MTKRACFALAALFDATINLIVCLVPSSAQPAFQGRGLAAWLIQYKTKPRIASFVSNLIRAILPASW